MNNLPKYLGIAFDEGNFIEIYQDLKELVTGETPNLFSDEEDEKTTNYFLCSIENTDNEELIEYVEDKGAEIFTCQFDINSDNAEFINKKPFVYNDDSEQEEEIKVETQTDNFILNILKLELETDIFKFVKDPENNENYDIFIQEQNAISVSYSRLAKDILAYQYDNILALVDKVEKELASDSDYQYLQEQENGIELLKENQKSSLEDLEQSYQSEINGLSSQLAQAIINKTAKEEKILRVQLESAHKHLKEEREALLEKQQQQLEGNNQQVENTRKALTQKVIDLAQKFTDYDFKALFKYEQRYIGARDQVVHAFSVDKEKERERLEKAELKKAQLLEAEKQERLRKEVEEQKRAEEQARIDRELEEQERIEEERQTQQQTKPTPHAPTSSQEPTNAPIGQRDITDKILNIGATSIPSQTIPEQAQYRESEQEQAPIQEAIEPQTEATPTSEELMKEQKIAEIMKNDTVQWSDKGSDETIYYENLEKAKKEEKLELDESSKKSKTSKKTVDDKSSNAKSDNALVSFVKGHKVAVISSVVGVILLGLISVSLAGGGHKSTSIESPKSSQTTKKQKSKKSTSSSSENKRALSETQYKENVKIMVDSNLGMYLDDNGDLTGTMKVKDSKGNISLRYIQEYTKYGELKVTDSDENKTTYNKKWVDSFIAQLSNRKQ